jgi:RHH-type rel operon transcriptional repressor/antitoxin RelB
MPRRLSGQAARSKSFVAVDALTRYVQSESWQIRDIQEGIKEADAGEFATDGQVKAVFGQVQHLIHGHQVDQDGASIHR